MENFIKYYSYNQLIEKFDILVMTEQEYLQHKDKLDNPKRVVLVNRAGGPREPKMPEWFKHWYENEYQKTQPQWFKSWCKEKFDPLVKRIENIEDILDRNNLH